MGADSNHDLRWRWASFGELTVFELYEVVQLRERVFVVEQSCVYLDADGLDPKAMHLLGWPSREGTSLSGYLRAFEPSEDGTIHIGRVVVNPSLRGGGVGGHLMREGMARARSRWGAHPVHISAQAHLRGFYGALGFVVVGASYDEDGIPHLPMRADP